MMKKLIFMVGERRSGTNLLRLMLSANNAIVAPHTVAILDKLMPLSSCYEHVPSKDRLGLMVDDVRHLIGLVPVGWRGPELTRDTIAPFCRNTSFTSILGGIMELCARDAGVPVCIHKDPNALRWHNEIERDIGEVGYIYLYRDPRDVVVSFARIADGDKHPYGIARHWANLQSSCLDTIHRLPEGMVATIRYEELVSDPVHELSRLCDFIGVPYSETMLQFYKKDEAHAAASHGNHWGKLNQPVTQGSVSRFTNEMSREDVEIVEFVAGDLMDRLGYQRAYPAKTFSENEITDFNRENDRRKAEVLLTDALAHIRAQRCFLDEIRARSNPKGGSSEAAE